MHFIAKTSKVQKNKLIQAKQGTQSGSANIIGQPQLHIQDVQYKTNKNLFGLKKFYDQN